MLSPLPAALPPLPVPETAYVRANIEDQGIRRARKVVALAAVLYGLSRLVGTALHLALAKGWAASPNTMGWGPINPWGAGLMVARSAADAGLVVGGLLLLTGHRWEIRVLRVSIAFLIALTVLGLVKSMIETPEIRRHWSTPGAAAAQVLACFSGLWLPLLVAALTLLPLAPPALHRSAGAAAADAEW